MFDLEHRLAENKDVTARELKNLDINLYNDLFEYAKSIDKNPVDVLRVYSQHGTLCLSAACIRCSTIFDVYNRKGVTCCKSCQSLYMHKTRTEDVKFSYREKLKKSNDIRRESGDLYETSKKAFRTRRERYGDVGIKDQYKKLGERTSLTAKNKREQKHY